MTKKVTVSKYIAALLLLLLIAQTITFWVPAAVADDDEEEDEEEDRDFTTNRRRTRDRDDEEDDFTRSITQTTVTETEERTETEEEYTETTTAEETEYTETTETEETETETTEVETTETEFEFNETTTTATRTIPNATLIKEKREALNKIRKAENRINTASRLIQEAGENGLNIADLARSLTNARELLNQARELIENGNYEAAAELAETAENIAGDVIDRVKELREAAQELSEQRAEAAETLSEVREELQRLEDRISQVAQNNTAINTLLQEIRDMLQSAQEVLDQNPVQAERLAKQAEELLDAVENMMEDIAREDETPEEMEEATVLNKTETRIVYDNGTVVERNIEIVAANNTIIHKVKVSVETPGDVEIVVEKKIITVGNRTIYQEIRKEIENGQVSISIEKVLNTTSGLGAVVGIDVEQEDGGDVRVVKVENDVTVKPVAVGSNELELEIAAPDGTGSRIIIVDVDRNLINVTNPAEVTVLVNNQPIELANRIDEILANTPKTPKYVVVIAADGVQVLLYIPHFSSYLVTIKKTQQPKEIEETIVVEQKDEKMTATTKLPPLVDVTNDPARLSLIVLMTILVAAIILGLKIRRGNGRNVYRARVM
ncbi:MAG TPA: hypothetical protein EYH45_06720 [Candidatus Caldiarchaeum subterraneum]|uniref:Uncharacterized protein n=1 Tax=Caldiarchaeum subterraneum TaxID=311458 RepID=A0A833EAG1_CALS0|nr:hypothetical protein [Candidatus Caldarchaeum subterraneum]